MKRGSYLAVQALALIVLAISMHNAVAQRGSSTEPSIAPSQVYLWNASPRAPVSFTISGDACNPPIDTSLDPDASNTFNCPNAKSFWIRVATGSANGGPPIVRQFRLENSHRYQLFFNDSLNAWDVQEIAAR